MLIAHLTQQLREREAQALLRQRAITQTPCAPQQSIRRGTQDARPMLCFCSNDYLGLANHPALVRALTQGAQKYGVGSGASHLVNGHSHAHAVLEETLATWMQPFIPQAQALSFSTGYMANIALLTTLGDTQATILSDKLNHASLVDGALLAKATLQRYAHGNLTVLQRQLEQCTTPIKLIVTDAVFSMDGDLADLPQLLALAERFDAWLLVDDAHGFGVLGTQGRGSLAHWRVCSDRIIYMGTLGKAAGVAGAFVAAHPTIIDWLVQTARPYIYTTASPPALAHALNASLAMIAGDEGQNRRDQLQLLITHLRAGLTALVAQHPKLGWRVADTHTPIQALIVGDNATALSISAALQAQGIWVPAIRPPSVPAGTARLRITLSAVHTTDQVLQLLQALGAIAEKMQTSKRSNRIQPQP